MLNTHFFHPVLVMQLCEVVKGPLTSDATVATTVELIKRIGRVPVLIEKEIDGFIVNRILHAASQEAMRLYEGGYADFASIDLAVEKGLNWPMGPFKLADFSGVDVTYNARREKFEASAEIEMAIRPGSHFTVRWIFRRGDGKQIGDLAVSIDTDRALADVQYLPPNNGTPVGIDSRDVPELFAGGVFVLTANTSADSGNRLYLNQEQVADFGNDKNTPTATTAIEVFGQGGEMQVLGLRGYSAP